VSFLEQSRVGAGTLLCFVSVLVLSACGDEGGATSPPSSPKVDAAWQKVHPVVPVPQGPPPTKLVVKELKHGTGPAVEKGDAIKVRFIGVDYRTAQVYQNAWDPPEPNSFNFGQGEMLGAWETGMKGMQVDDRRELIVPAKLAYGNSPTIYVLELLTIESG
jgi:peptidylprolyl isomerase